MDDDADAPDTCVGVVDCFGRDGMLDEDGIDGEVLDACEDEAHECAAGDDEQGKVVSFVKVQGFVSAVVVEV